MAESLSLFAVFPVALAPPSSSSRTQCSMQWHRRISVGVGSMHRTFGVGKSRVVASKSALWRGVCRALDQNSEGQATTPAPLEVYSVPMPFLFRTRSS